MQFGVLGSITAATEAGPVDLGHTKGRTVLAVLLSRPGRPVSPDRLMDALWGTEPPGNADTTLRWHVHQLRRLLGEKDRITRPADGYAIMVRQGELDADRFEDLYEQALSADPLRASALLDEAIALWRGPAYGDLAGLDVVHNEAARLNELHLSCLEKRSDTYLALGRHDQLIATLTTLTKEHPLRERFHAQLMLALYRAGRQGEALQAFAAVRDLLTEDLGIDPGPELQQIHQDILAADPSRLSLDPPPRAQPTVPAQLPPAPVAFVGRDAEAVRLRDLLGTAPRNVVLSGPGGIGKSTLAIHLAHLVADRYPDGQLYLNLHGSTPEVQPLEPPEALSRLLATLGVSGIPRDPDEAANRYRSAISGKRLLILLDNVRDAGQIRPLLPGNPDSAVIVTSRRMLTTLDGATHHQLDVLGPDLAAGLLARLIGEERVEAEPDATEEIVRACGGLPLAIRIAAARMITRPSWRLATLADRLAVEGRRLTELEADDSAVRASFAVSYRELDHCHRRMFRLISLLDASDIGVPVAAALAGVSEGRAEALLDHLADVQLLGANIPGRYRMHDLVKLFARERVHEEGIDEDRAQAVRHALHHYLATARMASRILDPASEFRTQMGPATEEPGCRLATVDRVNEWIDAERDNLATIAEQALDHGPDITVGLGAALRFPLIHRGLWREQFRLAELSLRGAEHTGDARSIAIANDDLARGHIATGSYQEALRRFTEALALWREIGLELAEGQTLRGLAYTHHHLDQPGKVRPYAEQAIALLRAGGDRRGEASAWITLGYSYCRLGELENSLRAHRTALALVDEPYWTATSLGNIAEVHRRRGDIDQALSLFGQAIKLDDSSGYAETYIHAEHLWGLGLAYRDKGDAARARTCWDRSARILDRLGLIDAEEKLKIESRDVPETPGAITRHF